MCILTAKVVYIYLYVEHFQCTPNLWFLSADWQLQVVLLVLVVLLVKYVVSLCTPTYAAGYKNCSFDLEWRHIHVKLRLMFPKKISKYCLFEACSRT